MSKVVPTQTLRTVIMRSLEKDSRYKDVLRDVHNNPDWHFATIVQHVEHAAHREDDLLAIAKGGTDHRRTARPDQFSRRPWTTPRTEGGGAPSPFQHRDTPYRESYHRRGARVHSAMEQHVPDPYDGYDEDPELDHDGYPVFFYLTLVVVLGETTDRRGVITSVCAASLSFLLSLDLMPKHADLRGCCNFLIQTVRRPGMIFPH